jgi:hypothetical protein
VKQVFSRLRFREVSIFWYLVPALTPIVVLGVSPNGYTLLAMAGHSLMIDSLFLLSRNNLLVAMLYHQGINTSFLFLISKAETPAGSALLLLVAIITRAVVHYRCALSPTRT